MSHSTPIELNRSIFEQLDLKMRETARAYIVINSARKDKKKGSSYIYYNN